MSFDVEDHSSQSASLCKAILVYEGSGRTFATIHPVELDGDTPVIRAGRAADSASIKRVCMSLVKSARLSSGVLPAHVLSIGVEHVVWWQPPGERTHFFRCSSGDDSKACVGNRSGIAPTPGIVFAVKNQTMWAFAVKSKDRPDADSPLFHMPTMNVWKEGRVCTGTMPLPNSTIAASTKAWEDAFWNSAFSHPNHPKPVIYKGGIHQLSIDLLDGKFKTFPNRVLNPIKDATLNSLIDALEAAK